MAKKTIQDRLADALAVRGETEVVPSKSGKYRQFTRRAGGFYWLGRGGALRIGQCSSKSISIDGRKANLLAGRAENGSKWGTVAEMDDDLLSRLEAAGLTAETPEHVRTDAGYKPGRTERSLNAADRKLLDSDPTRVASRCYCDRCLTIRAIKRRDGVDLRIGSDGKPLAAGPKPDTTQFGSPQTGFPEDGGTVGGPGFLPERRETGFHPAEQQADETIDDFYLRQQRRAAQGVAAAESPPSGVDGGDPTA